MRKFNLFCLLAMFLAVLPAGNAAEVLFDFEQERDVESWKIRHSGTDTLTRSREVVSGGRYALLFTAPQWDGKYSIWPAFETRRVPKDWSKFDRLCVTVYNDCLEATQFNLYLANTAGKTRLILPGYEAPDYSLSLQAGACTDGSLPVTFVKGTDVASVKYAVYTGRLDDGQVFTYADNIIRGEEPNVKTLGAGESSVTVSGMETGFYTLVAVAYDAIVSPVSEAVTLTV